MRVRFFGNQGNFDKRFEENKLKNLNDLKDHLIDRRK